MRWRMVILTKQRQVYGNKQVKKKKKNANTNGQSATLKDKKKKATISFSWIKSVGSIPNHYQFGFPLSRRLVSNKGELNSLSVLARSST